MSPQVAHQRRGGRRLSASAIEGTADISRTTRSRFVRDVGCSVSRRRAEGSEPLYYFFQGRPFARFVEPRFPRGPPEARGPADGANAHHPTRGRRAGAPHRCAPATHHGPAADSVASCRSALSPTAAPWSPAQAGALCCGVRGEHHPSPSVAADQNKPASAGEAALPNFLRTRSVDQVGRKSETTLRIASLHFEISTFSGTTTDQLKPPSGAADARHRQWG
jgi:hypothetical protein